MRYIIGALITFGLIILLLVMLFHGGGGSSKTPKTLILHDYVHSNSVAKLIIDQPVQSDQTHKEVEIDVSNSNVSFTLYNGYQQNVLRSQTYANNDDAYANFLLALQNEGFTKGNTDSKLADERGVCPLGTRNIYSFSDNSNQLMRFWSTTCGTATFKGKPSAVISLFQKQVPDYGKLLEDTSFNSSMF
jgi:hypothetical protein